MLHFALLLLTPAPAQAAASCPVTTAAVRPFAEPSPSNAARFWYGDESLAVLLRTGGIRRTRRTPYREKVFWWRRGYDGVKESSPGLRVTGRRLDREASSLIVSSTTNAYHSDFGGWAMLTGVEFPSDGCWELRGTYAGHELRWVVEIARWTSQR
jgi:hypothetical protein